jgi:hypothetical protein
MALYSQQNYLTLSHDLRKSLYLILRFLRTEPYKIYTCNVTSSQIMRIHVFKYNIFDLKILYWYKEVVMYRLCIFY